MLSAGLGGIAKINMCTKVEVFSFTGFGDARFNYGHVTWAMPPLGKFL